MKSNTPQHHKFLRLKRRFKLTLWQTVGILESLWLLTCTNAPDGAIGKLSNEDIAAGIDWQDDADSLITTLIECGWLDQCPKNRLVVHDWADHCPNYIRGGLAKKSKSFARVESDEVEPKVVPKVEPKVVPRVQPKDQPKDEPLCLDPSSLVYSGQANRFPIQAITGTAIEFPSALYLGPSGQSLPFVGMFVQSSGNPCKRSHSLGVRRLTCVDCITVG